MWGGGELRIINYELRIMGAERTSRVLAGRIKNYGSGVEIMCARGKNYELWEQVGHHSYEWESCELLEFLWGVF